MPESLQNCVIIDAVRSPIGIRGGMLAGIRPDNLMAQVISGLLTRNPALPLDLMDDVVLGCAFPEGAQGLLLARSAAILAGIPVSAPAKIVSRLGGSSMDAVHQVDAAVQLEDYRAAIAGGIEDMFSVPEGGFNPSYHPELVKKNYYLRMGESAEILAREGKIEREVQEEFALASHFKALDAWEKGRFNNEVIPVQHLNAIIARDEGPRKPEERDFASLAPEIFPGGTITAATRSPASVGAAALLMMGETLAEELGLKPRARLLSRAVAGVEWERSGMGALAAAEKALHKAGLTIEEIDAIELDESFAAQALYVILKSGWPFRKINLNGGALALGHPPGCAGARMLVTLLNVLEQRRSRYGLAALSIAGGQGISTVLERIPGEGWDGKTD